MRDLDGFPELPDDFFDDDEITSNVNNNNPFANFSQGKERANYQTRSQEPDGRQDDIRLGYYDSQQPTSTQSQLHDPEENFNFQGYQEELISYDEPVEESFDYQEELASYDESDPDTPEASIFSALPWKSIIVAVIAFALGLMGGLFVGSTNPETSEEVTEETTVESATEETPKENIVDEDSEEIEVSNNEELSGITAQEARNMCEEEANEKFDKADFNWEDEETVTIYVPELDKWFIEVTAMAVSEGEPEAEYNITCGISYTHEDASVSEFSSLSFG